MNEVRLQVLLDQYRTGTLTEADRAELERELLSSSAAREFFWREGRFHALLARWGQETWGRQLAEPPAENPATHAILWRWWVAGIAAAAAMLVAGLFFWNHRPQSAPGVAVLALASGAQWDGVAPKDVLAPGWLRLESGAAQIEFCSGARVIIEGPVALQLVSATEAFCRVGRLSAHVPAAARGFKVGAPGIMVTDRGTEFGLSIAKGSAPEVHVFTGKVELQRLATTPVELTAGKAVRVEPAALVSIAADRTAFLSESELGRRVLADTSQRLETWRGAALQLSQDSAALVHFVFDREPPWERTLANQAAGAPGSIVGCQWATGRWPGKGALRFGGPGDRVRLEVPGAMSAVTLLAWVRVEALPYEYNALLWPDGVAPGTMRWWLTQNGRLRFSIARESGRAEPNWEVVMSEPVVTPDRFGQWLCLATVFDGKLVQHYLNGVPVGKLSAYSPVPLRVGVAELGNARGTDEHELSMWLDEFALLNRALSADEIRRLHLMGQPEPTSWQGGNRVLK